MFRLFMLLLLLLVATPAFAQSPVNWSGGTGRALCDQSGTFTITVGSWTYTTSVTAGVATAPFTVPAVTAPPATRVPVATCKNAFGTEGPSTAQQVTFPIPSAPSAPTLLP